jgi:O-antigen ligase
MRRPTQATRTTLPAIERLLWWIVATTVVVVPLLISISGDERFRVPKEIAVRTLGLALMTTTVLGMLWSGWRPRLRAGDAPVLIAIVAVVWSLVTALASTNRVLSAFAFVRVAVLASFFLAAYMLLSDKPLSVSLWILLIPALINAALSSSQELNIWTPFRFNEPFTHHFVSTALIGNVNDVGAYLIVPALAAIVGALAAPSMRRVLLPAALLLIVALVLNQTLTAFVAFAAGATTLMLVMLNGRKRLIAVAVITALVITTVATFPPLRTRAGVIRKAFRDGRYDDIVTGRLPAYAAAWAMIEQRPLIGLGPGTFGFHYYFFRLRMEQRFPFLLTSNTRMQNFGEAHNDHLQVAAEAGIPAFLILVAALTQLAAITIRGPRAELSDVRTRFAQLLALPLAVSLFVLMLAQFPLQLASSTVAILFAIAMCSAWRPLHADHR